MDPVNPLPSESPKLPPWDMRVMNRPCTSPSTPVCPFPADDDLVGELLSEEIAHVDGLLDWEGLVCSTWQHFLLYQRPQGLKQVKADSCGSLTVSCFTWEVDSVILPAFAQQQMALTSP